MTSHERTEMTSPVDSDAHEFGTYIKSGGWRLGLLVARNVQPGAGQGARQPRNSRTEVRKISGQEFADRAGTSRPRTLRFFDAWEKAAAAGVVPHAADLNPGDEIDLPDDEKKPWSGYYSSGETKAQHIVKNKPAMRQAIAEDPEFAEAAAEALTATAPAQTKREAFKRLAADPDVAGHDRTRFEAEVSMRDAAAPVTARRREASERAKNSTARALGYTEALLDMDALVGVAKRIADRWTRGSDSWGDEQRTEFRQRWSETLHELDIASQVFASDLDAELADLLGGDQ